MLELGSMLDSPAAVGADSLGNPGNQCNLDVAALGTALHTGTPGTLAQDIVGRRHCPGYGLDKDPRGLADQCSPPETQVDSSGRNKTKRPAVTAPSDPELQSLCGPGRWPLPLLAGHRSPGRVRRYRVESQLVN